MVFNVTNNINHQDGAVFNSWRIWNEQQELVETWDILLTYNRNYKMCVQWNHWRFGQDLGERRMS